MGIKAHLARELQTMLASGTRETQLGAWLIKNAATVAEALEWSDDLVQIEEIDLKDMAKIARERGWMTPVATGTRRPSSPPTQ